MRLPCGWQNEKTWREKYQMYAIIDDVYSCVLKMCVCVCADRADWVNALRLVWHVSQTECFVILFSHLDVIELFFFSSDVSFRKVYRTNKKKTIISERHVHVGCVSASRWEWEWMLGLDGKPSGNLIHTIDVNASQTHARITYVCIHCDDYMICKPSAFFPRKKKIIHKRTRPRSLLVQSKCTIRRHSGEWWRWGLKCRQFSATLNLYRVSSHEQ